MRRKTFSKVGTATRTVPALLLFGGLLLLAGGLRAQEPAQVKAIRSVYQSVNASIALCNEVDEPCGYYHNSLKVNDKSEPWPVVGILQSEMDFWSQGMDTEEGPVNVLRKVNLTTFRSALVEYEEFLYDDSGKLLFYFFQLKSEGKSGQEYRFYFENAQLVHYTEKVAPEEAQYRYWSKNDAAKVLAHANDMATINSISLNR